MGFGGGGARVWVASTVAHTRVSIFRRLHGVWGRGGGLAWQTLKLSTPPSPMITAMASTSVVVPGLLALILALMIVALFVVSFCKRSALSHPCSAVFYSALFYSAEYSDLLACLAIFVVLPLEISKLLRSSEIEITTDQVGWAALNGTSGGACERGCVLGMCNDTACVGCGMCQPLPTVQRCPSLDTRQCAMGRPVLTIDCPALNASSPLLLVCALHGLLCMCGLTHTLSSLAKNRHAFRTHGFYVFVEAQRCGAWFQRFLRGFIIIVTLELVAALYFATQITHSSKADLATRGYEICGALLAIALDLASHKRCRAHALCPAPVESAVRLAVPFYWRAFSVLAAIDRALLASQLTSKTSSLDRLLADGNKAERRTELVEALTAHLRACHSPCADSAACTHRAITWRTMHARAGSKGGANSPNAPGGSSLPEQVASAERQLPGQKLALTCMDGQGALQSSTEDAPNPDTKETVHDQRPGPGSTCSRWPTVERVLSSSCGAHI